MLQSGSGHFYHGLDIFPPDVSISRTFLPSFYMVYEYDIPPSTTTIRQFIICHDPTSWVA